SSSAPFSNAWNPTSMRGSFFFAMARMMPWPRAGCIGPDRETGPQTGEKALYTLASRPYGAPHPPKRRGPAPDMNRTDPSKVKAKVLSPEHLAQLQPTLSKIRPMPAVFDKNVVKRLEGANVKRGTKRELANQLIQDIRGFMDKNKCTRAVMVWCASTEAYQEAGSEHQSIAAFEKALDADHPNIYPSQIYAYASISAGVPYLNGAPNMSCDFPALVEL